MCALNSTSPRGCRGETSAIVRIANPADFPEQGDFARIARLTVQANVMAYIRSSEIVLPQVVLERPEVQALQTADGKDNYTLALDTGSSGPAPRSGTRCRKHHRRR